MPNYVLNRDYLLSTTNGVISFKKGQPTGVPNHMEKDAVSIGAQCVDGPGVELLEPEVVPKEIVSAESREEQLRVAFDLIIERNDSKEFTGQGVPTVKAVEKITGIDFERSEVSEAWAAYKAEKAEA